jgi:ribose/xylose/arabinose/galactoside ABC-type transport system permease subunit
MLLKNIRLESLYVLGLLIITMSLLSPYFLSISNFLNILLATSVIGICAIGSTFVISSAGLDLSVGSVMGLAGVAGAVVMTQFELNWVFGILACIIAGGVAGFFNGLLVTRAQIPAFIVTLGMLGVARGAALLLCDGKPIYGLSNGFLFLGQGRPFGIPFPVIIFIVVALVTHYILSYTKFGKHTLVIGDNQIAADAMGININRHKVQLYALSGGLAGLAGMIFTSRVNAGDPTAGLNYELTAITAAIIGGTNLFGGKGSIIGTFIGALIMGVLQNGLNLLAVQSYYQRMAIGAVLILAVWFDQINRKNS